VGNIESVTLVTPESGCLIVTAHNAKPLGDEEWEEHYLKHVRKAKEQGILDRTANVVFAEGVGPTPKQRAATHGIFGKDQRYELKVAVVTSSVLVRGIVTTMSWFNPWIRPFGPEQWQQAFAHVHVRPDGHEKVLAALRQIRERIGQITVLDRCLESARRGEVRRGSP
jgi:hypothetical protein